MCSRTLEKNIKLFLFRYTPRMEWHFLCFIGSLSYLAFRKHRCENTPCLERFDVLVMGFAMSIVALPGRKHLAADALFRLVQSGCASLPDDRLGDTEIAFTDALRSAFAMFSLPAPSLLA